MTISIIIPTYNERKTIRSCLESLALQSRTFELVIVDDGSTDNSLDIIKRQSYIVKNRKILQQRHLGPGAARNLGARHAHGDILVFVDADMTVDKKFLEDLVIPIEQNRTKGTFAKEEYVANWTNMWARCWNYNQGIAENRRIPKNYPDVAPVFRAIRKKEFDRAGGFTPGIGWTDDWTLSQKLGFQALATSARCYHANPDSLAEVFVQAKWIGKNEFLVGTPLRLLVNILRYSLPVSVITGLMKSFIYREPHFLLFKIIYDTAVTLSLISSPLSTNRNK